MPSLMIRNLPDDLLERLHVYRDVQGVGMQPCVLRRFDSDAIAYAAADVWRDDLK